MVEEEEYIKEVGRGGRKEEAEEDGWRVAGACDADADVDADGYDDYGDHAGGGGGDDDDDEEENDDDRSQVSRLEAKWPSQEAFGALSGLS